MAHLPIACSLDAAARGRRQSDLRTGVLADAHPVERLPNGYRWQLRHAPDLLARLGPIIDAERHCCRFLDFAISAEGDRGSVVLEITGPSGTADFLESWIRPAP
ncbi:MAG: hypothetical protein H0W18_02100 [Acidobacteria bacterium]|nr:hypothetical protein [Acidobacteriota bacterium]